MLSARVHFIAVWFLLLPCAAAIGEPSSSAKPDASKPDASKPEPTVQSVLSDLCAAYAQSPTCERVLVQLRTPVIEEGGLLANPQRSTQTLRSARSSMIVRLDPGQLALSLPARVSIDLGPLRLFGTPAELIVTHDRNPDVFFALTSEIQDTKQSDTQRLMELVKTLPPIPLPQLMMLDPDSAGKLASLPPYAKHIIWNRLEPQTPGARQQARYVLHGSFEQGDITLTIQRSRLRELVLIYPEKSTTLSLRFASTFPCDLNRNEPDRQNRRPVEQLKDLQPRAGLVRVGSVVPPMPLSFADKASGLEKPDWSQTIDVLLQPPASEIVRGGEAALPTPLLAMVMVRSAMLNDLEQEFKPGDLSRLIENARNKALATRPGTDSVNIKPDKDNSSDVSVRNESEDAPLAAFSYAAVLMNESSDPQELLTGLRVMSEQWKCHVLWTGQVADTINAILPGADGAIVIIDAERVLRAIVPISRSSSAEQVMDELRDRLFELSS